MGGDWCSVLVQNKCSVICSNNDVREKEQKWGHYKGLIMASLKEEEISCLFSLNFQMCQKPTSDIVSNAMTFVYHF